MLLFRSGNRTRDEPPEGQVAIKAEPDDVVLVAAAQKDPQVFAPLYERYLGPIYRYCYVRLGDREAAEDATSETFLRALANLHGYRGGCFAAWLFRIAHNVAVDVHRRYHSTEPIESAGDPADLALTPEQATLARAEQEALRAVIASLPDDQRTVIELQLAGWSGQQIAEAMDRSTAAVKMLRIRALTRLRALFAKTGPDPREAFDEEP